MFLYLCRFYYRLPPSTITETLLLSLQKATHSLVHSRLPCWAVNLLLHLLHSLRFLLQRLLPLSCQFIEQTTCIWSQVLHEPHKHTFYLYRTHGYYLDLNYRRRLRHLQQLRSQTPINFEWTQRDHFRSFDATLQGSYVLLSIHMGDFIGAFQYILREIVKSRTVFALRREWQFELPPDSSLPIEIIQHGKHNPARLVASLRRGHSVLAAMFDLSDSFGQTTTVDFFDRRMEFVRGPAELAIVSGIPIIPFVCFERDRCNIIQMESVINTALLPGESLNEAVYRITRFLIRLAEKWIRADPAQWRFLHSLSPCRDRVAV